MQYCFNLFDQLIMLVRGRVVYFGQTAGAADFATMACPRVKEMTEGYNDAEFLVVSFNCLQMVLPNNETDDRASFEYLSIS